MCETVTQQTRVAPRGPFLASASLEPAEAPPRYVRFLGLGSANLSSLLISVRRETPRSLAA